ncbi:C40 family peptidase [Pseudemcibacter aquimaris]|uniref:C40 family peptidase n=1 Tax=Pseudemcibacter aquimaris TaxID=2857064 RepID=UPI002010F6DD|nr:C40 family peptidase [Pseudemcibacter aquimaris]MCC3862066.1 C40 family peptidase [Pseudemcibacter aquimaris]WDU58818.1 C40 family peptidase [Pseudemcibacter aquimaris]
MTHMDLDKRIYAYRDDIADINLKDKVKATLFKEPDKYQVAIGVAPLYPEAGYSKPMVSQLLFGEYFNVFEINDGWAWGQSIKDGYVGYCPVGNLTPDLHAATHHVSALSTHIYPEPNLKSMPVDKIHMMSDVAVIDEKQQNGFVPLADGNWIYATHIAKDYGKDAVSEALKFLYTPYLWGGRTNAGIDCSGLVQIAFASIGISVPRDADLQEAGFGNALKEDEVPEYGDLAFFPGHVGIMLDDMHLLHANAHHMRVSIDPLKEVIDIVSFQTDKPPLSCIKRVSFCI